MAKVFLTKTIHANGNVLTVAYATRELAQQHANALDDVSKGDKSVGKTEVIELEIQEK